MAKQILLVAGGDGSEHEISLISAQYVESKLKANSDFNVLSCVLHDREFTFKDGSKGYFVSGKQFQRVNAQNEVIDSLSIDCVVPCLHGFPGETGDFQAYCEFLGVPYIGCGKEASINCFNKVTTKLYLSALNIENTPYIFISSQDAISLKQAHEAFKTFGGDVYVKAASEGSSIGCYHVTDQSQLDQAISDAFGYCPLVLIEKTIEHRELEVAAYELDGELHVTEPGEIQIPSDVFYTFDEKYSSSSRSVTTVDAKGLSDMQREVIRSMAKRAFKGLGLRHLSRIDFFLSTDGTISINEINTFPGMTPISMFPKLVEHAGVKMEDFFANCVNDAIKSAK